MNATEAFVHLFAAGVRLRVEGGKLLASRRPAMTDDLRAVIRAHRDGLVELLRDLETPEAQSAFCKLYAIDRQRQRGEVPAHYTAVTNCAHCGPVPIFEGCPPHVQGCPWCLQDAIPQAARRRA